MSVNFMQVKTIVVAIGVSIAGMCYAADYYDQPAPAAPAVDESNMTPPPASQDGQGMMQHDGDMMNGQPPGMSGGRSNAPMPPPPPGEGTMAPPPGEDVPMTNPGPQSKRAPVVKSKASVSKR